MSSILFIAVQCCQCSTMQVKQKKKSSNWTCVVCNQKQSVRKVFAHSYMAKDIRKIVQSFNMSRKFADENHDDEQYETLIPITSPSDAGLLEDQQRKRRSDWNEYLDPTEDGTKENAKEGILLEEFSSVKMGDEFGPKIVTELPKELFKKSKLKNYASGKTNDNSHKPVFSKRNANRVSFSQGKEGKTHQPPKVISPHVWCDFMTRDQKEPRTTQSRPTIGLKGSKWDSYITNDDINLKERNGRNSEEDDIWDTMVDDHKVEDDIHPDFK